MTAHSDLQEAADSPVDDMDSAAAAISRFYDDAEDIDDREQSDDNNEQPEAESQSDDDDLDVTGEDEQEDEPETPAIDAPASLTAEEKAAFAALDPKSQRYVADLEARRATQVQTATTKAAEAQRVAEAAAARADAQAQAKYAQQLKAFGDNLAPQAPNPDLAYTDPQAFIAQQAHYQAAKAQHEEFMQQVQSIGSEAESTMSQAEIAERDRELMAIPDVANEATREEWFSKAIGEGKKLGLDMSQINYASAGELKALREIASLREKAEKYDAALSRQMQRVREGKKATTAKPNAAQPSSSEGRGVKEARQRARQTGSVDDAARALRAAGF